MVYCASPPVEKPTGSLAALALDCWQMALVCRQNDPIVCQSIGWTVGVLLGSHYSWLCLGFRGQTGGRVNCICVGLECCLLVVPACSIECRGGSVLCCFYILVALAAVQEERTFPPAKLAKTVMTQDTFQPPPNATAALMQNGGVINLAALPQTTAAASLPGLHTVIPSLSPYTYQYIAQAPTMQLVSIPVPQPASQTIFAPRMMLANQMALASAGQSMPNVTHLTGTSISASPKLSASPVATLTTKPASPDELSVTARMLTGEALKSEPLDMSPDMEQSMTNGGGVNGDFSCSPSPSSPGIDIDAMVAQCKGHLATGLHKSSEMMSLLSGESTAALQEAVRQVVDWASSIPAFVRLPIDAQCKALQNCWVEQLCLHLVYSGASASWGREIGSGMPLAKLAKEIGRTVRKLELDDKDVTCLRLLLLFNAGEWVVIVSFSGYLMLSEFLKAHKLWRLF